MCGCSREGIVVMDVIWRKYVVVVAVCQTRSVFKSVKVSVVEIAKRMN